MVAVAALGCFRRRPETLSRGQASFSPPAWTPGRLRIHSAALSPLRRFGRRTDGPASEGDGFQCETGKRNGRYSVSAIRATGSASNRERGAHAGLHSGPVPVAEMADDGQLRAVCCQHVGSEPGLGAKAG